MTQELLAGLLSFVNNRLVEAVADPLRKEYPEMDFFWLIYVSIISGFVLSYLAQVNLFAGFEQVPFQVGLVLTGLVVGGGSQILADVMNFLNAKKIS